MEPWNFDLPKQTHAALLDTAHQARLARMAQSANAVRTARPSPTARLALAAGDGLIRAGLWLKRRYSAQFKPAYPRFFLDLN